MKLFSRCMLPGQEPTTKTCCYPHPSLILHWTETRVRVSCLARAGSTVQYSTLECGDGIWCDPAGWLTPQGEPRILAGIWLCQPLATNHQHQPSEEVSPRCTPIAILTLSPILCCISAKASSATCHCLSVATIAAVASASAGQEVAVAAAYNATRLCHFHFPCLPKCAQLSLS